MSTSFSRFLGITAGEKLARAVGRRERAGEVEANATEEFASEESSDGTMRNCLSLANTGSSTRLKRGTAG
jgi:hypothetical protein